MIKWEYEFAVNPSRRLLKHLGEEGWEVITVVVSSPGYDVYYFKRPTNFMEIQNELREAWIGAIKATFAELFDD